MPFTPGALPAIAVATVAAVATVTDLRTRRVPNALTLGAGAAGLVTAALGIGGLGAGAALAGGGIGLLLMLPGYLFGSTGAGDVKLLAAFGTWLGPRDTLTAFMAMALAGGAIAVAALLHRRNAPNADRHIAYAPAVAIGAMVAALT